MIAGHLRHGLNMDDVAEYARIGISADDLNREEIREFSPAEIERAMKETRLSAATTARLLHHNAHSLTPIDPAAAKTFGDRFTPAEIVELQAAGVPGATAKSLRNRMRSLSNRHLAQLYVAGVTNGNDAKTWDEITAPPRNFAPGQSENAGEITRRIVKAASSGVPATAAASYVHAKITEPAHWAALHNAGLDVDTWLRPGGSSIGRANTQIPRQQARELIIDGMVKFKAAGGTPKLMRDMLRAGIPSHEHANHIGTADLWAAGAPFREELLADEVRFGTTYATPRKPWPWDESTYTDDADVN